MNINSFADIFEDLTEEYGRDAFVTFYPNGQSFGGSRNRVSIDIVDPDTVDDYCVLYFYDTSNTNNGKELTLGSITDVAEEAVYEFVSAELKIYFVDEYGENINVDSCNLPYCVNNGVDEEEYVL